ncbi:MAG: DUF342 domain-containing protein, partial [Calditrichaeota bacterium]
MNLELSENKLKAYLTFQEEDLANPVDIASIEKLLHEAKITNGKISEDWQEAYNKFQQNTLEDNKCMIAEGTPAIEGK